jgi:hypothetical protein
MPPSDATPAAEPHFEVIFRACDVVTAVNGAPRPFGLDKRTLIQVCFASLQLALQPVSHRITVLGDKLSSELSAFFEAQAGVQLLHGSFGNEGSIRRTFELAGERARPQDWIYFCEDDYLHVPQAMTQVRDLIVNRRQAMEHHPRGDSLASLLDPGSADLVIFPADYPDRYRGRYRRFSMVFHTANSHWRQVSDSTFTFLMQGSTFARHRALLERCASGANDRLLSRSLYARHHFRKRALCVSPMPGLSTHMHTGTMTPVVDWSGIVQRHLAALAAKTA